MLLVGYPAHACNYSNLFLTLVISKTECADIVGVVSLVACASGVMLVSESVHNFVFGPRVPAHITLLCLVTDTLVAVNATVHTSLHNLPMEISECLARPGNMYPFLADLVRPLMVKAHCMFVDSIEQSGSVTLMCCFSLTGSTGAEG